MATTKKHRQPHASPFGTGSVRDTDRCNPSGNMPLLLMAQFADNLYPSKVRLSVEISEREGRPPDRMVLIEA